MYCKCKLTNPIEKCIIHVSWPSKTDDARFARLVLKIDLMLMTRVQCCFEWQNLISNGL